MKKDFFVNREKELSFLNKLYKNKSSDLFILYGRRRIGKTKLILEFNKNKKSIYYLSSQEGDLINIKNLQKELASFTEKEFLNLNISTWYDLFYLFYKFYKKNEKLVLCIDEFPYLIKKNNAIPSIFQKIWDQLLVNKNILLILTGSSMSVMEKKVLNIKSPLYGRRTAQWDLKPIPFKHIVGFIPKQNIEDLFKYYFIFGGIPAYLNKIDSNKSFVENIADLIFTKGNYLNQEGNLLINYEFSESTNYKLILGAISRGYLKQKEIVEQTFLDYSLVSKYLFVLKSLFLIKEEIPVTEKRSFKGRLYKINDNYLEFFNRYLTSNLSFLESNNPQEIYNYYKEDINKYFGYKFEDLIKELFEGNYLSLSGKYSSFGRMWGKVSYKYNLSTDQKTYEIDIVGLDPVLKNILFCEVKWKKDVNAEHIAKELISKSKYVSWNKEKRSQEFVIVAKSFFKKITSFEDKKITCLDLNDISKRLGFI